MRSSISKTIVAGLATLAMAAAVTLPTTSASAGWGGGNWHGGGGWHGGGWGNGWRGGGSWHPGFWRGGVWNNGWWGPAIAAGVAAGALATYPYWGYPNGYANNGCWQYRPTYDAYGNYLGEQWVSVC
jgi:hypothetical protein